LVTHQTSHLPTLHTWGSGCVRKQSENKATSNFGIKRQKSPGHLAQTILLNGYARDRRFAAVALETGEEMGTVHKYPITMLSYFVS